MMKLSGIICEYNPFHNGHAYQIQRTRDAGATHIVAVMGGHFMQRGDLACFSKWARAEAALACGVDLVLELPALFACASAERCALGGVALLNGLGCVSQLSFGSEGGGAALLQQCAQACLVIDSTPEMGCFLKQGMSYPRARQLAVAALYGEEVAEVLEQPNNTLGVEYIKAALRLDAGFSFLAIPRQGAAHDSAAAMAGFASATGLRRLLMQEKFQEISQLVPPAAWEIYSRELAQGAAPALGSRLETAVLCRLRTATADQFARLPDVTEGLENRLVRCARQAVTVQGFVEMVKTKRYTLSRIRRIVHFLLLGVSKEELQGLPQYARVLGCNTRGREVLHKVRKTAKIPVTTDFAKLAKAFPRAAALDAAATDLFALAQPVVGVGGQDFTRRAVVLTS